MRPPGRFAPPRSLMHSESCPFRRRSGDRLRPCRGHVGESTRSDGARRCNTAPVTVRFITRRLRRSPPSGEQTAGNGPHKKGKPPGTATHRGCPLISQIAYNDMQIVCQTLLRMLYKLREERKPFYNNGLACLMLSGILDSSFPVDFRLFRKTNTPRLVVCGSTYKFNTCMALRLFRKYITRKRCSGRAYRGNHRKRGLPHRGGGCNDHEGEKNPLPNASGRRLCCCLFCCT